MSTQDSSERLAALTRKQIAGKRYALCKSCEKFKATTKFCGVCGCFMPLKVNMLSMSCPDDPSKWPAEDGQQTPDTELERDTEEKRRLAAVINWQPDEIIWQLM